MLTVRAPDGVPEVRAGDDLAGLLLAVATPDEGDVVVVTSKVVSKAEGRVSSGDRVAARRAESVRVVAERHRVVITRHRLGLTMAAAGVDASNVTAGQVLLLPIDPDATARALRAEIHRRTGRLVGVVIADTAGRPWRHGQTDIAIGAAGLCVTEDFSGREDGYGNSLVVTAPAVADELAGTAELATGKLGRRPFTLISGRADLVLPITDPGPGARALIRGEHEDLFGYGAREAVIAAVAQSDRAGFGAAATAAELSEILRRLGLSAQPDKAGLVLAEKPAAWLMPVLFACGWQVSPDDDTRLRIVA